LRIYWSPPPSGADVDVLVLGKQGRRELEHPFHAAPTIVVQFGAITLNTSPISSRPLPAAKLRAAETAGQAQQPCRQARGRAAGTKADADPPAVALEILSHAASHPGWCHGCAVSVFWPVHWLWRRPHLVGAACCRFSRMKRDRAALSYWFPKIEAAGIPVPRITITGMPRRVLTALARHIECPPCLGDGCQPEHSA
jgi:hypothetical protein